MSLKERIDGNQDLIERSSQLSTGEHPVSSYILSKR